MAEGFEKAWENLTAGEKDSFLRSARTLLRGTFIVADKNEESRRQYIFVSKKQPLFSEYFRYIGFDLLVDREMRVVMLQNIAPAGTQGNKLNFTLADSIVLCCLWSLYVDRVGRGTLARNITVPLTELRFQFDKYGVREKMDRKKVMEGSLKVLRRFNLIDYGPDVSDPDCVIRIYPSVQFALNMEEFKAFAADAAKRFTNPSGASSGTENAFGEDMEHAEDPDAPDEDDEDA